LKERDWQRLNLTGDPRLLLAQRRGKRIDAYRVEVHQNLFETLRDIATSAVGELERRDPKAWSPFGAMTHDDYFDVDVPGIPLKIDRRRKPDDPAAQEIASALQMVARTDEHPTVSRDQLLALKPTLYAIVFEDDGEYIGFVRAASPRSTIKPGVKFLQYDNVLKRIDPPDLAIDEKVDIVVAPDRCAVLSSAAFTTLFGDVGIAFEAVGPNTSAMSDALEKTLPLATSSVAEITAWCGRRVTDARRLHYIANDRGSALRALKKSELTGLVKKRGLGHAIVNGELVLANEQVGDFLDLVEGRLYDDDVTGQERRADAYSPRRA
jgi:hypothetical protein